MLNRAERYRTLEFYRISSFFCLHPIEVDLTNWKLTAPCKTKRWVSCLSLVILVFHTLYKNGSLVNAYFFDPNVQLHQLVIHAVLAMDSIMIVFYYVVVYISDPHLFAVYVHLTLLGNVGGNTRFASSHCNDWKKDLSGFLFDFSSFLILALPAETNTEICFNCRPTGRK